MLPKVTVWQSGAAYFVLGFALVSLFSNTEFNDN
jgi:hypothetical protein